MRSVERSANPEIERERRKDVDLAFALLEIGEEYGKYSGLMANC